MIDAEDVATALNDRPHPDVLRPVQPGADRRQSLGALGERTTTPAVEPEADRLPADPLAQRLRTPPNDRPPSKVE